MKASAAEFHPRGAAASHTTGDLRCDLCGVTCCTEAEFRKHCAGGRHLKGCQRLIGVGCAPSLDSRPKVSYVGEEGQKNLPEYARQRISPELNAAVVELLGKLFAFQERMRLKDPMKAKTRRRLLFGLREVGKALKLRKVRLLLVAPNLESVDSRGGPDELLQEILAAATEAEVEVIFALTRSKLGRAIRNHVRISVVAVLDFNGADAEFQRVMELGEAGRRAYYSSGL